MRDLIKNKSGASMMFVLAVMFFLLTIGTSALTAAASNAGAGFDKRTRNQLMLYADSLERSVHESLINGELGKQVLIKTCADIPFDSVDEGESVNYHTGAILPFPLTLSSAHINVSTFTSVSMSIDYNASFTRYKPEEYWEEWDYERDPVTGAPLADEQGRYTQRLVASGYYDPIPQTASISGTVSIIIRTELSDKTMMTVMEHSFSNAEFEGPESAASPMSLITIVEWELISHEKADW